MALRNSNDEKYLTKKEFLEIDHAILREDITFLQKYVEATSNGEIRRVNLSKDPLLNVMIAYNSKDGILLELINKMVPKDLMAKNKVGDTVLHVAAAKDRVAVATAIILKNEDLIKERNNNSETPLLKAAHFGSVNTFNYLLNSGSDILARNKDGANVLHCAISGNNPDFALKIAQQHQLLMITRNDNALTPLQLMVTIPEVIQSSLELGPAESLIYAIIPLNSHNESKKLREERDEEAPCKSTDSEQLKQYWTVDYEDSAENDKLPKESTAKSRKKILKNCQRYVTEGAFQMRCFIISILKILFTRVKELEEHKKKHAQTMNLVAYLARDPGYWDFIQKGMYNQLNDDINSQRMMSFMKEIDDNDECDDESDYNENDSSELKKEIVTKKEPEPPRWYDSPLIVGAKMGLDDFVEQILKACPQSAEINDMEGRNVLQVAIKYGHVNIVKIIAKMIEGPNPVLPSWLLSDVKGSEVTDDKVLPSQLSPSFHQDNNQKKEDDEKKNTILHYAAETTIKGEGLALQMRHEIKWFEMVKELLPKDMVYNRNKKEKTAQELFDENHAEMMKSGRNQLMDIGKTCSGLLAAVAFAASFNIPEGNDSDSPKNNTMTKFTDQGNHLSNQSDGYKVFAHAYMIGLSLSACSLILFLSLLTSNYRREAFRKSLPTKFALAGASFLLGLFALLVAFTSNAYLIIYGRGKPAEVKVLVILILEVTAFPLLWAVVWFFGGFGLGFSDFILKMFRR
ncbi:Caskin/Ankyrin repeat-containing protein [Dioscorea alata]|uniref:Caskin/Ankyrin repeat-containing protein n=2 Tax=Dioscorea alata TaxID=55571 RepID=A0ACB7WLE7_DIOAL|nr:Caskin/Ankyrin repeat-containing protein [Dioscorea alata]